MMIPETTTKINFVGFDYSMTSPAMCVLPDDGGWANSTTYFLTDKPKYAQVYGTQKGFQVIGQSHKLYNSQQQRFENIAAYFIGILQQFKHLSIVIAIEDYSMGSKGKVFHIAENTGLLKYFLWKYQYNFTLVAPTTIKKFATGKGNAKKEQMRDAFIGETSTSAFDLSKHMGQTGKLDSPVTDVIDAYYIAKYAKVLHEQNSVGSNQT